LNLDENVISAMDDLAEKRGMSRSQVGNQILSATLGESNTADVLKVMFSSAFETTKSKQGAKTKGKSTAKVGA
jgi:hypothetical protein